MTSHSQSQSQSLDVNEPLNADKVTKNLTRGKRLFPWSAPNRQFSRASTWASSAQPERQLYPPVNKRSVSISRLYIGKKEKEWLTRMHSSRMRTARSLPYGGSLFREGLCPWRGLCSGGFCLGVSLSGGSPRGLCLVVGTETEARTVSKRAVCILLECCPVLVLFC